MAADLKRALKMPMGGFLAKTPDKNERERKPRRWTTWLLVFVVIAVISLIVYNVLPSIKNEEDFQ